MDRLVEKYTKSLNTSLDFIRGTMEVVNWKRSVHSCHSFLSSNFTPGNDYGL